MSQYPNSMNIQTATGKKTKFDLSHTHIATSDLGVMQPVTTYEMVPGDSFRLKIDHFLRLMPMPAPTFGAVQCRLRAFFVPYRCAWKPFNDFISRQYPVDKSGNTSLFRVPYFTSPYLYSCFTILSNGLCTSAGAASPSPHSSDLNIVSNIISSGGKLSSASYTGFNFTPKGRRVWQLLQSLGYNLPSFGSTSSGSGYVAPFSYSALPLLSWWKFYLDWIVPARFVHNYDKVRGILDSFGNSGQLLSSDLLPLLNPSYGYYPADFFTSAWITPDGTETDLNTDVTVNMPSPSGKYTSNARQRVFISGGFSPTDEPSGAFIAMDTDPDDTNRPNTALLGKYSLMALGRLQSLINRGKLAGSKVQDWFVSTYGLRPSDAALNLSSYLGSSASVVQIGDVMSTAGTDSNVLGQFAGRGVGGNTSNFSYEAKEHGMLFVTYELVTKASYYQGLDPACTRTTINSFFIPELDNVGVDAVTTFQFAHGFQNVIAPGDAATVFSNSLFGFTPRFSNYKYKNDMITGDFRCNSLNATLKPWYLARFFEAKDHALWQSINENFCKCTTDSPLQDLDYIFNADTNASDHFYFIFDVNCSAMRPMVSLSDALEIDDDNKMGRNIKLKTAD